MNLCRRLFLIIFIILRSAVPAILLGRTVKTSIYGAFSVPGHVQIFSNRTIPHVMTMHNGTLSTFCTDIITKDWARWTLKVVPIVFCIGMYGHYTGGSPDAVMKVAGMVVLGLLIMDSFREKVPLNTVGKDGIVHVGNQLPYLAREGVRDAAGIVGVALVISTIVKPLVEKLLKNNKQINNQ